MKSNYLIMKMNRLLVCRYRASEPERWDYDAAGIPTPLTEELESQQQAKQVPHLVPNSHYHISCSRICDQTGFVIPKDTCVAWNKLI